MSNRLEISRRTFIGGAASVAAIPLLVGKSVASPKTGPVAKKSRALARGGRPRFLHAAAALSDGRVLVCGGYNTDATSRDLLGQQPSTSVQIFDPASGKWSECAPLKTPRARHAAVGLPDGRVAVIGGFFNSPLNSVEIYDPITDRWAAGTALPQPICDHTASLVRDGIVLMGGPTGTLVLKVNI